MKILILNYEYPPLGGGAGIVTQHLANEFASKGNQVTVLTTWMAGVPEYHSQENNITIIRLKSKRKFSYQSNPFEMLDWIIKAKRFADKHFYPNQFDVCLSNFTLPCGALAIYLNNIYKCPYVVLSHGHDIPWFSPKQMFIWHLIFYPIIKNVLKKSEYNILLTGQLKGNADKFLGIKYVSKNIVIPNGVMPFNFRKGFDANDKIINALFVGRLVEQKDPLTLINALEILSKKDIQIHLKIAGDGILKDEIEKQIAAKNILNVELLGKISHSQVLEEYSKAHILIAPSREEAMSLSILESLSAGVYIFATRVSGNREIIIEDVNGNFVEYGNANDISEKIYNFYINKFLKNYQYPESIMQYIRHNYSWDKVAGRYLELFNDIQRKFT